MVIGPIICLHHVGGLPCTVDYQFDVMLVIFVNYTDKKNNALI